MAKAKKAKSTPGAQTDTDEISVWFWFFMILVLWIPLVNIMVILVGSFLGSNQTRRNFFRAHLIWMLLFVVVGVIAFVLGIAPALWEAFQDWIRPAPARIE